MHLMMLPLSWKSSSFIFKVHKLRFGIGLVVSERQFAGGSSVIGRFCGGRLPLSY